MASSVDTAVRISRDLELPRPGVLAVLGLLDGGSTVPFIARYRKEATGNLDEVQIRAIQERHAYVTELESRRETVRAAIESQGKLTDELARRLAAAESKAEIEDAYLPFKRRRRTRAAKARERGLEPLAERILAQPTTGEPRSEAAEYIDSERGVADAEDALCGARDIAAEVIAERADLRAFVREILREHGVVTSRVTKDHREARTKFEQYYEFGEAVRLIPSHRYLALRRGEAEGVLRVTIDIDTDRMLAELAKRVGIRRRSPFAAELEAALTDGYKRLLAPSIENEVGAELKARADESAVGIFADNLRNLLLAAPLGGKAVIGIDPGQRTGCKCAAVDATGQFQGHMTFYLTRGGESADRGERDLVAFVRRHRPAALAIGNGTGGREALAFVKKALERADVRDISVVHVNEAGASVYSASDVARQEFPELDLTIRGAISIARRLQDPLAELVKIEPKAIGVGQYQHDVHQPLLAQKLEEVVESCVNHVGVELNTASAPLLSYVSGIGPALAKRIVDRRDGHGPFESRGDLLRVKGLGARTFEQCAGFLRLRDAAHPLDRSAVHPERYDLVARMATDLGVELGNLVGDPKLVGRIDIGRYVGDDVGEPTLRDILSELEKPGRDPRDSFEPPRFRDDVQSIEDLRRGMSLEGVVTNVVAFGAFVDVGVHQDGLVHISQLADRYVRDPSTIVKVGDRLTVRVLDVDLERGRISLSARSDSPTGSSAGPGRPAGGPKPRSQPHDGLREDDGPKPTRRSFSNNPFAKLERGGKG